MPRTEHTSLKENNKMSPTELAIKTADKAQGHDALEDCPSNQKLLLSQVFLEKLRTGHSTEESLNAVDPDCELTSDCQTFLELHANEPLDGAIGIVLGLLLNLG